jgi:hypothetical protein
MKNVTLVELTVYEKIIPLVSGYLQAYAQADQEIGGEYRFTKVVDSARTPLDKLTSDVLATNAEVYAFSCYVWNTGVLRKLIKRVREARPAAHIMLGGPQVMHHGERYLSRDDERMVLCNGEGEVTFTEYLRELGQGGPDLSRVNGLSFYADGALVTTPPRERISDLNSIPSPFLAGVFDPCTEFSTSVIETNRGCPFRCGFCYWGAATNDRVNRFDEDRVRDEISWMAKNEIVYMFIADANWGMLGRDIDLSRHIAAQSRQHGHPNLVYFSSSKNKPKAVTQIVSILTDAGLIAAQPVSMQTVEPASLKLIERQNIKLEAFEQLQADLRERGVSSFIELIWPLPGETLESFKRGIGTLCEKDAHSIIAYGNLLLHNSPLYANREKFGLATRSASDEVAEAEIVVRTREVTESQFGDGMRFAYAVQAIQNTRALRATARYLSESGLRGYADLLDDFVRYWGTRTAGDPIVDYVERSVRDAGYYDINNYGLFLHELLHAARGTFASQLAGFAASQPWWKDQAARAFFEIDLVNRPYLYSNTPLDQLDYPFEEVRLLKAGRRSYLVEVPERWHAGLAAAVALEPGPEGTTRFEVDHRRMQFPFKASHSLDHNGSYGFGVIQRPANMMPQWRPSTERQT